MTVFWEIYSELMKAQLRSYIKANNGRWLPNDLSAKKAEIANQLLEAVTNPGANGFDEFHTDLQPNDRYILFVRELSANAKREAKKARVKAEKGEASFEQMLERIQQISQFLVEKCTLYGILHISIHKDGQYLIPREDAEPLKTKDAYITLRKELVKYLGLTQLKCWKHSGSVKVRVQEWLHGALDAKRESLIELVIQKIEANGNLLGTSEKVGLDRESEDFALGILRYVSFLESKNNGLCEESTATKSVGIGGWIPFWTPALPVSNTPGPGKLGPALVSAREQIEKQYDVELDLKESDEKTLSH